MLMMAVMAMMAMMWMDRVRPRAEKNLPEQKKDDDEGRRG
jgi:hypothetical protein